MKKKIPCAIYTRKSSEEGLDQDFNSLDAQRAACAAYITSQKAEGWVLLPEQYEGGGVPCGTLKRPALQRFLDDLKQSVLTRSRFTRLTACLGRSRILPKS